MAAPARMQAPLPGPPAPMLRQAIRRGPKPTRSRQRNRIRRPKQPRSRSLIRRPGQHCPRRRTRRRLLRRPRWRRRRRRRCRSRAPCESPTPNLGRCPSLSLSRHRRRSPSSSRSPCLRRSQRLSQHRGRRQDVPRLLHLSRRPARRRGRLCRPSSRALERRAPQPPTGTVQPGRRDRTVVAEAVPAPRRAADKARHRLAATQRPRVAVAARATITAGWRPG